MDGHGGGAGAGPGPGKLTRTPSSLLRSPTVRNCSSFQAVVVEDPEPDDKKAQAHPKAPPHHFHPGGGGFGGPAHPLLVLALPLAFLLLLLLLRGGGDGHHLALLAASAAAALAAAAGAARLLRGRLRLRRSPGSGSVQWFIGDDDDKPQKRADKAAAPHGRVVREGVEFYSNGDCYEGEFHKGRCNGSGVYNFFGKGKYEGDWVDGKYDGYGIESWARGSRYLGQYRQGLRHGHGVYRFYSGDCYAGEWAGGQSHGIGAQTCSDGSSYVGEFKCGVKHGLGSYHFRWALKRNSTANRFLGDCLNSEHGLLISTVPLKFVSEMAIVMRASTLGTRSTGLVSTASPMGIATKAPGTKARSRDLGCTHSGMATSDQGTGILGLSGPPCPRLILLFSAPYR